MCTGILDSSAPDVLEMLRRTSRPVIIFGAGRFGELILNAARKFDIPVACFCDNNPHLSNHVIQGVKVLNPDEAMSQYKDAYYFIAVYNIHTLLHELEERQLLENCLSIDILRLAYPKFEGLPKRVASSVERALFVQQSLKLDHAVYIGSVNLVVTDYCTLRCRDCSIRAPHVRNPVHYPVDEVIDLLDTFLSNVDGVYELGLVGGDALTHPHIVEIAQKALLRDKIKEVCVYTNGIIELSRAPWKDIHSDRLCFRVTRYDNPKQNLAAFEQSVKDLGFKYYESHSPVWQKYEIGPDAKRTIRNPFPICRASICFALNRGKLFRCQLVANAMAEGLIPDDKSNYLNIACDGENLTRTDIWNFVYNKQTMAACNFCSGVIPGIFPNVEPAIQL